MVGALAAGWQHANREPWALAASTNCVHIAQGKPSVLKKGGGVTLFFALFSTLIITPRFDETGGYNWLL
jgi:hypothetical protein